MTKIVATLFITFFISTTLCGQWVSKAYARKKRSEVTSVIYNGKLYAFFGFRDSALNVEPGVEVYDPLANTWQLLGSLPLNKAVTHQGVALIDSNVWLIGGRVGRDPGPLTNEIWIYNITSNSFSAGPPIIDPATGEPLLWGAGGATFLGRTLHIFGGFIINACNNDQGTYHLTLNVDDWLTNPAQAAPWKNELAPLPVKRNHFGTAVLGGKIYAIGGQFGHDCDGGLDKQYSHVYNPSTDTWTELPLLPAPRSHIEGGTFAIDGKIYLVAGQGTYGVSQNKVTIFDPNGNNGAGSWTDDNNLTLPKRYEGVSAKVINNTFIIDHGGEGGSQGTRNTTYSRTLLRTPVYKLGFTSGCANLNALSGGSAKAKTLLFTIDGSKSYSISPGASWLTITKNASGIAIPNGVDIEITANSAGLAPGNYSATVTATGIGSGPDYTAASYCINLAVSPTSGIMEAEAAVLNKAVVATNQPGFTGTGFVDYLNNTGDFIEWTLNKTSPGSVSLNFRYANGSLVNRPLKLEVNGIVVTANLAFPPTGGWTKWSIATDTVNLVTGANKIKLTAVGSSGANIDHLAWNDVSSMLSKPFRDISIVATDSTSSLLPSNFRTFIVPNPVSGNAKLFVKTSSDIRVEIIIVDIFGRVHKKLPFKNFRAGYLEFSVNNLPSGPYFVIVSQGSKRTTSRFVVEK
ncbi:MAG: carbohydrate-binding protein [Ginsengibacter sp.]